MFLNYQIIRFILDTTKKVLMNLHWQFCGNFKTRFWTFYFEWFYGGADFERKILPAHRSVPTISRSRFAHAPLVFWTRSPIRSAPLQSDFDPPRSVFPSAHAPLTCSTGDGRPPVGSRGKATVEVWGSKSPFQKLKQNVKLACNLIFNVSFPVQNLG